MSAHPEDLRSEQATPTGGEQPPAVPDPALVSTQPAGPIPTSEPTDAAATPELTESGCPWRAGCCLTHRRCGERRTGWGRGRGGDRWGCRSRCGCSA